MSKRLWCAVAHFTSCGIPDIMHDTVMAHGETDALVALLLKLKKHRPGATIIHHDVWPIDDAQILEAADLIRAEREGGILRYLKARVCESELLRDPNLSGAAREILSEIADGRFPSAQKEGGA